MNVLMLGWEFPPHFSGGLGVVCYELTKAYREKGIHTTYVMPFGPDDIQADYVDLIVASNYGEERIEIERVDTPITPYMDDEEYQEYVADRYESDLDGAATDVYGKTLFDEVRRFADVATEIAQRTQFDIVHVNDWPTFPAGKQIKQATGKPLVTHVHATEFDRTGGNNLNQNVYDLEREGMHAADEVIAVSNKVKEHITTQYALSEDNVTVVHNAINAEPREDHDMTIAEQDKIVLSLGRITLQKGPEYFLKAAKRVLDHDPNVKFIMAGTGDMHEEMIHLAAELGIADNVLFPGFVPRETADELYRAADVFVMPSVSEPFGITPLEALAQDTPVIISEQSGVSEVLDHCITVDFWDTEKIAQNILALLHYQQLHNEITEHGKFEVEALEWSDTANECLALYDEVIARD